MTLNRREPLKRSPMKKSAPKREWRLALQKVEEEGCCRVCGVTEGVQAAHIVGRKHDPEVTGPRGGKVLMVLAESIVPLCPEHHIAYDARLLDLLPYLRVEEQMDAVRAAGGIIAALKRVTGETGA